MTAVLELDDIAEATLLITPGLRRVLLVGAREFDRVGGAWFHESPWSRRTAVTCPDTIAALDARERALRSPAPIVPARVEGVTGLLPAPIGERAVSPSFSVRSAAHRAGAVSDPGLPPTGSGTAPLVSVGAGAKK